MNSININNEGYSAPNSADNAQNNWAAAFAKREVDKHREAEVLDHPDGCVTVEKLSDGVREMISEAVGVVQSVTETANNAKNIADAAKTSADIAVSEAENAYDKSLDADSKADDAVLISNTAKVKSETAEQRAISAETKADAAVASASGAVQKAEDVQSDLEEHGNNFDIHTTAAEKEEIKERFDGIFGSIDVLGMMATTSIQYWQPNTYYKEGQVVYVKTSISENPYDAIYKCITTHTSKQDFLPYYEETLIWDILCGVTAEFTESAGFAGMSLETRFAECDLDGNNLVDTYAKKTELETAEQRAISAETKADAAVASASGAVQKAMTAEDTVKKHINDSDIHLTEVEKFNINEMFPVLFQMAQEANDAVSMHQHDETIHTTAEEKEIIDLRINEALVEARTARGIAESADGFAYEAKTAAMSEKEAVVESVLDGLTEKIRITSLPVVGAYTGWQIYADGNPLSENIIPICDSFVTAAGVMTGLTAGFFQNDKEIVRCKMNVTEHGSVKYVNFSDYERISEKNEIEYMQKKMVGVHFGRLNSSVTGSVTLTDIPDNSLILLASDEGLELNAKGQSGTLSATAKHLVIWTGSTKDHEVYGTTDKRMTYLVYTQDMSLTNLKPYNIYTAYTKAKADAADGDTGISIVCPVHTYIGVIGAEFPK